MKNCIICCVPEKSYIWEKFCSWDIGQSALSQSDCRIFKSTVSPEQIDETASVWYVDTNSQKLKVDWKIFSLSMVKNGYGQSRLWTLKLAVSQVSQEWTDRINWFFCMMVQIHAKN